MEKLLLQVEELLPEEVAERIKVILDPEEVIHRLAIIPKVNLNLIFNLMKGFKKQISSRSNFTKGIIQDFKQTINEAKKKLKSDSIYSYLFKSFTSLLKN